MRAVLFGWLGPPDTALGEEMGKALRHRGEAITWLERPEGSLAVACSTDGLGSYEGFASADGCLLAVTGFFTDVSLPEIPGEEDGRPVPLPARLLSAYQRFGPSFAARLQGAFCIALIDRDKLVLVRDAIGERTLYHGVLGNRHVFAAETKAIWSIASFSRVLRPAALAEYFTFSFLPGTGTMLENLWEVLPGHTVTCSRSEAPRYEPYLSVHEDSALAGIADEADETVWVRLFQDRLRQAIATRLPSNGPVAAYLSGGIDSSVVVAELADMAPGRLQTYAVHFGEAFPNELAFASSVAKQCGADHREVLVRPRDFLPDLRRIVWHLDEPIGDPVTMPNFMLANQLDTEFPGVFNGEGGDPSFGGPKNIPMMMQFWYGGMHREPGFLERAYLASYRRAYEEWPSLLRYDWAARIDSRRDLESILTPFFYEGEERLLLRRLMTINLKLKGAHLILPKVERMLAAHGRVPLSPLFDLSLVRLAFALPPNLILQGAVEKMILKKAYANRLPEDVVNRPKSGMRVPVHFWFKGELKRFARRMLSKKQLNRAGIFDPARVKKLLDYNYEEGRARYGLRLWMLVTFEFWRRMVFEGERP